MRTFRLKSQYLNTSPSTSHKMLNQILIACLTVLSNSEAITWNTKVTLNEKPCSKNRGSSNCHTSLELAEICHGWESILLPNLTWYLAAWIDSPTDLKTFDENFYKLYLARSTPFKILVHCETFYQEGIFLYFQLNEDLTFQYWIRFKLEQLGMSECNLVVSKIYSNGTQSCESFSVGIKIHFHNKGMFQNMLEFLLIAPEEDRANNFYFDLYFVSEKHYTEKKDLLTQFIALNRLNLEDFTHDQINTDLIKDDCIENVMVEYYFAGGAAIRNLIIDIVICFLILISILTTAGMFSYLYFKIRKLKFRREPKTIPTKLQLKGI